MKTLTLILGLFLMSLNANSQKVITVDNRPNTGADYTSLSEAITAAFVGDTIQIHPSSTSYGNVTATKTLHFVGLSHNPANSKYNERAFLGIITFNGTCPNSSVRGLELNVITTSAAATNVSDMTIKNNKILSQINCANNQNNQNWLIEGNIFDGAFVQPYSDNWIVKNNIFDNTTYAVYNANNTFSFLNNLVILSNGNFASNCADPLVNNNIFILEGSTSEVVLNNSTVVFNNNLTRNVQGQTVTALSGSNNLNNTDPGFSFTFPNIADFYNNDYNVTGAAENAGTDGTDLGVFGAGFNFDAQGRPDDYPYMTSLDISNSTVPMGQDINVTFSAAKKN